MGRQAQVRAVHILHIGRTEPIYARVWQGFQQDGITVTFARTQTMGLQLARELEPHIVVINTLNSHFSGQRLCQTIGRRLPRCQRVLFGGQGEGKQIECEERLIRPFTVRKLRETITNLIKNVTPHVLRVGDLELDVIARVVTTPAGIKSHLTPKQCRLLTVLMQHPNQVISRQEIMKEIWETHYLGDTRTLDVHIRWLRERIEVNPMQPAFLVTKRGIGYKLVAPSGEGENSDLPQDSEPEEAAVG